MWYADGCWRDAEHCATGGLSASRTLSRFLCEALLFLGGGRLPPAQPRQIPSDTNCPPSSLRTCAANLCSWPANEERWLFGVLLLPAGQECTVHLKWSLLALGNFKRTLYPCMASALLPVAWNLLTCLWCSTLAWQLGPIVLTHAEWDSFVYSARMRTQHGVRYVNLSL